MNLSDVKNLSDKEVREELYRLRWPSNNGKPICPKCLSKKEPATKGQRSDYRCRDCGKSFNYRTMTPFIFCQSGDRKILSLILSARDELSSSEAAKVCGVKIDTARKWLKDIKKEFISDENGELLFPKPSDVYQYREKERSPKEEKAVVKKISKREIASYILKRKCVIISQFKDEYKDKYDLTGSEQFINSLATKNRDQLKLISHGKDPFESKTKEINNIQEKIHEKEKRQLEGIKIPNFNDTDPDIFNSGV
jgi:transposase-like protein